jgi:hypothetical protein
MDAPFNNFFVTPDGEYNTHFVVVVSPSHWRHGEDQVVEAQRKFIHDAIATKLQTCLTASLAGDRRMDEVQVEENEIVALDSFADFCTGAVERDGEEKQQ